MLCSGVEQIPCIPLDSGFVLLAVVFITEDLETFCCRLCGTVQPNGFEVQDRSSGIHFDSSTENLAMAFISS